MVKRWVVMGFFEEGGRWWVVVEFTMERTRSFRVSWLLWRERKMVLVGKAEMLSERVERRREGW